MIIFYSSIKSLHGLKGEVEISFKDKSYFASLPVLSENTPVIINGKEFIILKIKKKNKSFVFQIKDIENIELAKELIGCDIYIDSKYLPKLDEETFYEAELTGYKIIDENKNIYGEIVDIYSLPSNYVFNIVLAENKKKVSIPFVKAYFGKADKINKTIEIIQKPIFDD
ncbi:ribosome maturation factor RimM [Brachyspira catarrhinii]|uniref:Ribosome maturation factor RimM n=1 Tax=Brachyspira catarrhinii TaxID=2528966 RepID=A0ABY2TRE7_9SPIR|nr:ribosome maturation factor RimM [Brachyspira catarrhinii]TKZ35334.1 16S rRNA processing protein RimM [Brachyspira catarrhinii]